MTVNVEVESHWQRSDDSATFEARILEPKSRRLLGRAACSLPLSRLDAPDHGDIEQIERRVISTALQRAGHAAS